MMVSKSGGMGVDTQDQVLGCGAHLHDEIARANYLTRTLSQHAQVVRVDSGLSVSMHRPVSAGVFSTS